MARLRSSLTSPDEKMQDITFHDVVVSDCGEGTSFDRLESFPGLKQDLDDVYVFEFYLILTAIIFTFICVSILCCCDYSGNTQRLHPRYERGVLRAMTVESLCIASLCINN